MILNYELEDYRTAMPTVTEVRVTKDIQFADVWFSALGEQHQRRALLTTITLDAVRLRKMLAGRIYLRHIPELRFHLDDTMQYAEQIDRALTQAGITLTTGLESEPAPE